MILKSLQLFSVFRGLPAGYTIDFNPYKPEELSNNNLDPICLVGLNGSGKSNVLEALSEIFYYLESYHRANNTLKNLAQFKAGFGFKISYILPKTHVTSNSISDDEIIAQIDSMKQDPHITIEKHSDAFPQISITSGSTIIAIENKNNNRDSGILPARVIGYSSGMNELLSNAFIKMNLQYLNDSEDRQTSPTIGESSVNSLFFMDYDSNKYITICNYLFDKNDIDIENYRRKTQVTDFAGLDLSKLRSKSRVDDIAYFTVTLRLKKTKGDEYSYLPPDLDHALTRLKRCATFIEETETTTVKNNLSFIQLDFWVNKQTKAAFQDLFRTANELFRILYNFQLLNTGIIRRNTRNRIIKSKSGDIESLSDELPNPTHDKLVFRVHNIKLKTTLDKQLEYKQLSDGEHQLLQILGAIILMDVPGTLFLLDEPETHFNPEWRSTLIELMNHSVNEQRAQQVILTTHSPFIVSDCKRENVFLFSRHKDGHIKPAVNPSMNTFGTSASILLDELFNKSESISKLALSKIEEIKQGRLSSPKDIQKAKESARALGESPEKILLFRELLLKEDQIRNDA